MDEFENRDGDGHNASVLRRTRLYANRRAKSAGSFLLLPFPAPRCKRNQLADNRVNYFREVLSCSAQVLSGCRTSASPRSSTRSRRKLPRSPPPTRSPPPPPAPPPP